MPRAVEYVEKEGDHWKPLPNGIYITSIEMQEFETGKYSSNVHPSGIVYHALKFDSGEIWDAINGFRNSEMEK